ncbi:MULTISPECIES: Lsr2 family protein [unclassified Streptomyces]|uniref:histone-like nucleoid-structuring protein Lsr2 n=1 Tax=unclassified Streptomyces TaxID=2593676 RepID=UPI0029BDE573|nr:MULTISPECIES: Lsr2 family protein [unclassified Streptomyces]MDX3772053.1 Lsr2 family protein [Streptomyces sp. AK08-01B]MDX3821578.1 Lsr2 family protein [Streptomyces sp. AK08-01A]
MAQKIVTIYTDDLTDVESEDVQTHTFSLDGVNYEIDLVSENYDKLFEALAPFIGNGRKLGRTSSARRSRKAPADGPRAEEIRAWARENGHEVNNRGRVPASIREAYQKVR